MGICAMRLEDSNGVTQHTEDPPYCYNNIDDLFEASSSTSWKVHGEPVHSRKAIVANTLKQWINIK